MAVIYSEVVDNIMFCMYYEVNIHLEKWPMNRPSLRDVAREAGVSPATASRILNNDVGFPAQTRMRVLAAVEKLKYVPRLSFRNALKRFPHGLHKDTPRRTNNIALLWKQFYMTMPVAHILTGEILQEMCLEAERRGFNLLIMLVSDETVIPEPVLEERVDAAIVYMETPVQLLNRVKAHVPVVLAGASGQAVDTSGVRVNEYRAHLKALKHLADLGHSRIGYFTRKGYHRHALVMKAMEELGLEIVPEWTDPVDFTVENMNEAVSRTLERFMAGTTRPTAILAEEFPAVRFVHDLTMRGVDVPGQMSVVCIGDNMSPISLAHVPLTAIRYPMKEMGAWAVKEAARLIETPNQPAQNLEIEATLVVRASSGPAPQNA